MNTGKVITGYNMKGVLDTDLIIKAIEAMEYKQGIKTSKSKVRNITLNPVYWISREDYYEDNDEKIKTKNEYEEYKY